MAIDEILRGATKYNLACDTNLRILFETYWRLLLVVVVKYYRNRGLGYPCLASFVDQVLRW